MKSAWDKQELNGQRGSHTKISDHTTDRDSEILDDDEDSCTCCPGRGRCCKLFMKYTVGRSIQLAFYILDIATDLGVAFADFQNGDIIFACVTLGLVFAPGFLYAVYAFTEVLTTHTGILACLKAPLWLLAFPFLPLWPIIRDLHQMYHGIMSLFPNHRSEHLQHLNKPSRAYLLKFLEAFTEAAPQILLRLYKIALKRQEMPFYGVEKLEIAQVTFSLASLSSKIISTYQKNITTAQVINGEIEDHERFKLPCCIQLMAFLWWVSFLMARFEAMALFAGSLKWWLAVVIVVHVLLVFLFQTVAAHKNRARRIFIYLFSGFVFIFAYLQFNMKTRMKVAPWFSYTVYTILVLIENSIMLVVWYFKQQITTSNLPDDEQMKVTNHRHLLIYIHYGLFGYGLVMMVFTFWCAPRKTREEIIEEEEMRTVRLS